MRVAEHRPVGHRSELVSYQGSLNQQDRLTGASDVDLEDNVTQKDIFHSPIQSAETDTVNRIHATVQWLGRLRAR